MNIVSVLIDVDSVLMNVVCLLFYVVAFKINVAHLLINTALIKMNPVPFKTKGVATIIALTPAQCAHILFCICQFSNAAKQKDSATPRAYNANTKVFFLYRHGYSDNKKIK